MNVKIAIERVYCVLDKYSIPYEKLWETVDVECKNTKVTFPPRSVGPGYLQWSIEGSDWQKLSDANGVIKADVDAELEMIYSLLQSRIDCGDIMMSTMLVAPSDEYVYYRVVSGHITEIVVTAWGYKFPQRPTIDPQYVNKDPEVVKQQVKVRFVKAGKPIPNCPFVISDLDRATNSNGELLLGKLKVGDSYQIQALGYVFNLDVEEGKEY